MIEQTVISDKFNPQKCGSFCLSQWRLPQTWMMHHVIFSNLRGYFLCVK